jgi:3-phenylpropionate/trans-cinnamate dioxygenase ferredoxin reductase subunit
LTRGFADIRELTDALVGPEEGDFLTDLLRRVVIVGAGHAGGSAAALLRQYGWMGPIIVIGEEPVAPYQRPPLSKAWLKGEADAESLALRPAGFYAQNRIGLRLSVGVSRLDALARTVTLTTGELLSYDELILATGARARKLPIPGADLGGVLELRTAADAESLKRALGRGKRLAVIGGGYVGLEAAASARALGAEAVIVEREARVLARVACETVSTFFHDQHRERGVVFEVNAGVERFVGEAGRVTAVKLADGRTLPCDAALVGVGAIANEELARRAGCACENGIVVDARARTTLDHIHAIGDCTWRPLPLYGRMGRLESVPNALEQARQAASDLTGRPIPAAETPWFWSDQYDIKLQIAGMPFHAVRQIVRGDPADTRFAVFHLDVENRVQSVEAVNAAPEFMGGRQLVGNRRPVAPDKLGDLSVSMKEVAV